MSINRTNRDYSGGYPLAVGDRHYAQDLLRDLAYAEEQAGALASDIMDGTAIAVKGGIVSKGAGDNLNITAAIGYAPFDITVPDTWSALPPPTRTETLTSKRVVAAAQTNLAIPSAVLDGVTTNYVKLRYVEIDGPTRVRAKSSGSYAYEKVASYQYIVDTVAPTAYDIPLASFTAVPGTFTITNAAYPSVGGDRYEFEPGITPPVPGDVVALSQNGKLVKYVMNGAEAVAQAAPQYICPCWVSAIDYSRFIAVISQNGVGGSLIVGTVAEDGAITYGTPLQITVYGGSSAGYTSVCMLTDTTGVALYSGSDRAVRTIAFTISGTTITAGAAVLMGLLHAASSASQGRIKKISSTVFVAVYGGTDGTQTPYARAGSVSGTTITLGNQLQLSAVTKYIQTANMASVYNYSPGVYLLYIFAMLQGTGSYFFSVGVNGTTLTLRNTTPVSGLINTTAMTPVKGNTSFPLISVLTGRTTVTGMVIYQHLITPASNGTGATYEDMEVPAFPGYVAGNYNFEENGTIDAATDDDEVMVAITKTHIAGTNYHVLMIMRIADGMVIAKRHYNVGYGQTFTTAAQGVCALTGKNGATGHRFVIAYPNVNGYPMARSLTMPTRIIGILKNTGGEVFTKKTKNAGALTFSFVPGANYYADPAGGPPTLTPSIYYLGRAVSKQELIIEPRWAI